MGFFDYVTDLYGSLSFQPAEAEERQFEGPEDNSGQQASGKDARSGGVGTAQHDRDATTKGGVSTKVPHAGTDEESDEEKEANEDTAGKAASRQPDGGDKGHTPGEGGASSGQKGAEASGPHGGPVKAAANDDDEEEEEAEDEEEEEEDDEPVDPKGKLEEGECLTYNSMLPNATSDADSSDEHYVHPSGLTVQQRLAQYRALIMIECIRSQQCAPLKHHYDECAERVTKQQEENGKADEDCVEEFFHLMHCASACAAPKLFKQLR